LYAAGNSKITVVFRYDDVSYNIDIEEYLIKVFNEYNIPVTFGVVVGGGHLPDSAIAKLRSLDKKKEVEIAMHGFAHTHTELFGTYDQQYKLLKRGRDNLENDFQTNVETFIPPYNAYPLTTLKVLQALNFKVFSGDENGPFQNNSKIIFLPETCSIISLKNDILNFRKEKLGRGIFVVMFHHYDFTEDNNKMSVINKHDFEGLIKWVTSQSDINVMSLGEASKLIDGKNFLNYGEIGTLPAVKYLPINQHLFINLPFIPSNEAFKKLESKSWVYLTIYYFSLALIVFFVAYYTCRVKFIQARIKIIFYSAAVPLLLIFIFTPAKFLFTLLVIIAGLLMLFYFANRKARIVAANPQVNIG
jgi:peptidoglycan/xylan/chitin deacetylase (PgdA/CDA1 family)